jgi:hypothetical protein
VVACHCQRRTGSPFGVSTYFPKEQARTEGQTTSTAGATRGEYLNSISVPTAAPRSSGPRNLRVAVFLELSLSRDAPPAAA